MDSYRRFFSSHTRLITTLVVLLALTFVYYRFYVANRETHFKHQYLRLLGFESDRLAQTVSVYRDLFQSYRQLGHADGGRQESDIDNLPRLVAGVERVAKVDANFLVPDMRVTVRERIDDDRLFLYFGWPDSPLPPLVYRFQPFEQYQPSTDTLQSFDTFLVARRDGTVLYQRGKRDLQVLSLRKLLGSDGKELDLDSLTNGSSEVDVRLAGETFKLFLQPCCRKLREQLDAGAKQPAAPAALADARPRALEWVMGGLVSEVKVHAEARSISSPLGILLVAAVALSLLAAPFLRVFYCGPGERIRVADALVIGATAMAAIGMLTLLFLDVEAYGEMGRDLDRRLERFSSQLQVNVRKELTAAAAELAELDRFAGKATAWSCGPPPGGESAAVWKGTLLDNLEHAGGAPRFFAEAERFFWVGQNGVQCLKWSSGEIAEPLVDVSDRLYFRQAVSGEMGVIAPAPPGTCPPALPGAGAPRFRFALQPVFSMSTARRIVVLASPSQANARSCTPSRSCPAGKPCVAALAFEMSSLARPVLPSGYGFAVIDGDGEVQFHSDASRSGQENLFAEVNRDPGMVAAVGARRSSRITTQYLGMQHRFFVRPMGDLLPFWTLVVWSDQRETRELNVDLMTTALLLLILYLLSFIVPASLLHRLRPAYRAGWLWPDRGRTLAYMRLTGLYVLALVLFLVALHDLPGVHLLLFCLVFPWVLLAASYLLLRRGAAAPGAGLIVVAALAAGVAVHRLTSGPGWVWWLALPSCGLLLGAGWLSRWVEARRPSFRAWYLTAASLLLLLSAALPATGFFFVSYGSQAEPRLRSRQLELAKNLVARDQRLRELYGQLADGLARHGMTLAPMLIARRQSHDSWDVYKCESELPKGLSPAAIPPGWLPESLLRRLPPYDEDYANARRLGENVDRGGDTMWSWSTGPERAVQMALQPTQGSPIFVTTPAPSLAVAGWPWLWPVGALAVILLAASIAWFVADQLLALRLPAPDHDRPNDAIDRGECRNYLLIGPDSQRTLLARSPDWQTAAIDLRELESSAAGSWILDQLTASPVVYLKHLECCLADPQFSSRVLVLLEELLNGRRRTLIVLSSIDPRWHLLHRDADAEDERERWTRLFERLTVRIAEPAGGAMLESLQLYWRDPGTERQFARLLQAARAEACGSPTLERIAFDLLLDVPASQAGDRTWFIDELRLKASRHYKTVWGACDEAEKVVLVHLAEGSLVNPKSQSAVKDLTDRGLVRRAPHFKLMNESFRLFIVTSFCRAEGRTLEQSAEPSLWSEVRLPLTIVLLTLAAFVFATERDIFNLWTAFIAATAAFLPQLSQLVGSLFGTRPGPAVLKDSSP